MVKKLTDEQKKIVDYSHVHGIKETTEVFHVSYDHVSYLRQKLLRIKEQEDSHNSIDKFIELPLEEMRFKTTPDDKEMITFLAHGASFKISKEDFKKVFFND